jgi:hypothetical protein
MRRMIMEPQPVIQDGEIRMVQLEQMLERPVSLVRRGFNVVHLDGRDVYGLRCRRGSPEAQAWQGERCE